MESKNSILAWTPVIGMFTAAFKLGYVKEKIGMKWAMYQLCALCALCTAILFSVYNL